MTGRTQSIFSRAGMGRKDARSPFVAAKRKPGPKPFGAPQPIDDIAALPAGPRVICNYPPVILNPNARPHPIAKARAAKAYRQDCFYLTKAAGLSAPTTPLIPIRIDFFPPDKRKRDDDNAASAFKSGRDGIADALGIDDNRFRITTVWHAETRACVIVTLMIDQSEMEIAA